MTLLDLQSRLQSFVRQTEIRPNQVRPLLSSASGASPDVRASVYHFAYRTRLTQVLREAFDKTWAYLGDASFDRAIATYIEQIPSDSFSLDDYGSGFVGHVETLFQGEKDVHELCWLDWTMRRAFDGPDAVSLQPHVLAELSGDAWESVGFVFHPTLKLRLVSTNVGALWSGLDTQSPEAVPALTEGMAIRVWRKYLQPCFRMITTEEMQAISEITKGLTFAGLCERLAHNRAVDDPVQKAAGWLTGWLTDGLITDFTGLGISRDAA